MGWEGLHTPLQVSRYLVVVLLARVHCGDRVCDYDGMVMFGWMMSSKIIGDIVLTYFKVCKIVDLIYSVTYPIEIYVYGPGAALYNVFIGKTIYFGIICYNRCGWLWVYHLMECNAEGGSTLEVEK